MMFRSAAILVSAIALAGAARAQAPDLSALHDALHLTVQQEDGWRAYRNAIAPDPSAASRHRSAAMMMATLTTPRRVDLVNAEMSENLTTVHRQGEAVKAFYATLTPDQQRTFDHQTLQTGGGSNSQGLHQPSGNQPLPQPRQH